MRTAESAKIPMRPQPLESPLGAGEADLDLGGSVIIIGLGLHRDWHGAESQSLRREARGEGIARGRGGAKLLLAYFSSHAHFPRKTGAAPSIAGTIGTERSCSTRGEVASSSSGDHLTESAAAADVNAIDCGMNAALKKGWRSSPFHFTTMSTEFISYLNLAPYSSAQRETFNNDGLLSIIEQNPGLARTKHEFTFASGAVPPIFMAVSLGANKKLVSALAEACPAALGQTDRYGRTALHQAVEFGSSVDVVQYICEQRPQSAADTDHIGRTPLHCACAYSASIDIVRLLCNYCPKSVFQKDNRGRLPVHISCAHEDDGASIQVVRYLLELYPLAVYERTAKGSTVLELVEKGRASLEVMLSVSAVAAMLKENQPRATALSLVSRLESMDWRTGVLLYLDVNPSVIHVLDLHREEKLMPHLLSSVGKRCKLGTMFEIVKGVAECLSEEDRSDSMDRPS